MKKPADAHPTPLTPEQRLLILDSWQRSGLPAGDFAPLVGVSKHTLYSWKNKFEAEGLSADLYRGPAHNDLGVLLLKKGKLYEAAGEFTWAGKLLPGHPDPRVNLALVLDRGGKFAEAVAMCRTALEIQPGYLPAAEAAVLIQVRDRKTDESTRANLCEIAERETDDQWRQWLSRSG